MAQPKNPSPYIQIALLGKGSTEFRPSINLAIEEVDVSLKEYVKAAKELYNQDSTTTLRDLGAFDMKGGKGRLLELTNPSGWGEIKILQAILVKHEKAYILTAAVLKSEFATFQKNLLACLKSLDVAEDLWTPISDPKARSGFKELFASLGKGEKEQQWQKFQSQVLSIVELGAYWQFLALQEGRALCKK